MMTKNKLHRVNESKFYDKWFQKKFVLLILKLIKDKEFKPANLFQDFIFHKNRSLFC